MKDDDDCGSVLFNRRHLRIDHSVMLAKSNHQLPRSTPVMGERALMYLDGL
jgi:hypothetical protein